MQLIVLRNKELIPYSISRKSLVMTEPLPFLTDLPDLTRHRIQTSVCWGGGGGHNQTRGQGGRLGRGSGGEGPDGKMILSVLE